MAKRGHGEGSIFQRKSDGRWVGQATINGKRVAVYGTTRKEAAQKLRVLLQEAEAHTPGRETLGGFLDRWLAHIAPRVKPRTLDTYRDVLRLYVRPALGNTRLQALTVEQLDRHFQQLRQRISKETGKPISPKTILLVRGTLRAALTQARRWKLISENPVSDTASIPQEHHEQTIWTPDEARHFLATTTGHQHAALFRLSLLLGMRQGELLALRWHDVDLDGASLAVTGTLQSKGAKTIGTPKSAAGRRTLPLPASAVRALRLHRLKQHEARLWAGSAWEEQGLVFPSKEGAPLNRVGLVQSFRRATVRVGLPEIRYHDLRHCCASLLASEGVPAHIAQAILGHASARMTAHYTHAYQEATREALATLDRVLESA